jgi:anti-sigma factor RsiW
MNDRIVIHSTFSLERVYDAPAGRVFAAWADPAAKSRTEAGCPARAGWRTSRPGCCRRLPGVIGRSSEQAAAGCGLAGPDGLTMGGRR